ncbi:unnamed protein product [Amoebophrya sp. A120]|nr:unnamed protein product [Amoebophrya sp. A120]|eukprot:GSA120T00018135001.1
MATSRGRGRRRTFFGKMIATVCALLVLTAQIADQSIIAATKLAGANVPGRDCRSHGDHDAPLSTSGGLAVADAFDIEELSWTRKTSSSSKEDPNKVDTTLLAHNLAFLTKSDCRAVRTTSKQIEECGKLEDKRVEAAWQEVLATEEKLRRQQLPALKLAFEKLFKERRQLEKVAGLNKTFFRPELREIGEEILAKAERLTTLVWKFVDSEEQGDREFQTMLDQKIDVEPGAVSRPQKSFKDTTGKINPAYLQEERNKRGREPRSRKNFIRVRDSMFKHLKTASLEFLQIAAEFHDEQKTAEADEKRRLQKEHDLADLEYVGARTRRAAAGCDNEPATGSTSSAPGAATTSLQEQETSGAAPHAPADVLLSHGGRRSCGPPTSLDELFIADELGRRVGTTSAPHNADDHDLAPLCSSPKTSTILEARSAAGKNFRRSKYFHKDTTTRTSSTASTAPSLYDPLQESQKLAKQLQIYGAVIATAFVYRWITDPENRSDVISLRKDKKEFETVQELLSLLRIELPEEKRNGATARQDDLRNSKYWFSADAVSQVETRMFHVNNLKLLKHLQQRGYLGGHHDGNEITAKQGTASSNRSLISPFHLTKTLLLERTILEFPVDYSISGRDTYSSANGQQLSEADLALDVGGYAVSAQVLMRKWEIEKKRLQREELAQRRTLHGDVEQDDFHAAEDAVAGEILKAPMTTSTQVEEHYLKHPLLFELEEAVAMLGAFEVKDLVGNKSKGSMSSSSVLGRAAGMRPQRTSRAAPPPMIAVTNRDYHNWLLLTMRAAFPPDLERTFKRRRFPGRKNPDGYPAILVGRQLVARRLIQVANFEAEQAVLLMRPSDVGTISMPEIISPFLKELLESLVLGRVGRREDWRMDKSYTVREQLQRAMLSEFLGKEKMHAFGASGYLVFEILNGLHKKQFELVEVVVDDAVVEMTSAAAAGVYPRGASASSKTISGKEAAGRTKEHSTTSKTRKFYVQGRTNFPLLAWDHLESLCGGAGNIKMACHQKLVPFLRASKVLTEVLLSTSLHNSPPVDVVPASSTAIGSRTTSAHQEQLVQVQQQPGGLLVLPQHLLHQEQQPPTGNKGPVLVAAKSAEMKQIHPSFFSFLNRLQEKNALQLFYKSWFTEKHVIMIKQDRNLNSQTRGRVVQLHADVKGPLRWQLFWILKVHGHIQRSLGAQAAAAHAAFFNMELEEYHVGGAAGATGARSAASAASPPVAQMRDLFAGTNISTAGQLQGSASSGSSSGTGVSGSGGYQVQELLRGNNTMSSLNTEQEHPHQSATTTTVGGDEADSDDASGSSGGMNMEAEVDSATGRPELLQVLFTGAQPVLESQSPPFSPGLELVPLPTTEVLAASDVEVDIDDHSTDDLLLLPPPSVLLEEPAERDSDDHVLDVLSDLGTTDEEEFPPIEIIERPVRDWARELLGSSGDSSSSSSSGGEGSGTSTSLSTSSELQDSVGERRVRRRRGRRSESLAGRGRATVRPGRGRGPPTGAPQQGQQQSSPRPPPQMLSRTPSPARRNRSRSPGFNTPQRPARMSPSSPRPAGTAAAVGRRLGVSLRPRATVLV